MSGLENMVSLAVTPIVTPNNSLPNNVLSDFGVTASENMVTPVTPTWCHYLVTPVTPKLCNLLYYKE